MVTTSLKNTAGTKSIAHYGVLAAFMLTLLGSLAYPNGTLMLPFVPMTLVLFLISSTIYIFYTKSIDYKKLKSSLFIGLNAFGLLALLSTFYSEYPMLTALRSLQFIIVTNCLYVILSCIKDLKKLFENIGKITILFTLISCIYGLIIYFFGSSYSLKKITTSEIEFLGFEFSQRMHRGRISSFFGNPNLFGVRLMVSIIASLYFIKVYRNLWYTLAIAIFLYTLLLTGSRASMVGLLAGTALFLHYSYINQHLSKKTLRIILVGIGLLGVSYVLLNPEPGKEIFSIMGRTNNNLNGREVIWAALIEQIKQTPILGIGYRISTEALLTGLSVKVPHSHNLYLSVR